MILPERASSRKMAETGFGGLTKMTHLIDKDSHLIDKDTHLIHKKIHLNLEQSMVTTMCMVGRWEREDSLT